MKIVHVCISAPWDEKYAYQENLLPHYHRLMGHDVTIIAPVFNTIGDYKQNRSSVGNYILPDGAKVVRLAPWIDNGLWLSHIPSVKGLKEAIIVESPDLLFLHDVCCFNYRCVVSIKKHNPNLRIVADNHCDYINSLHSPITRFLHKVIYKYYLIPKLKSVVECFYGVTPSRCTFLHEVYDIPKKMIKLLMMGADDEKMMIEKREQLREKIRERHGIKEDDFLIVTGGKIDRLKNIHILARAVNALNRKNIKLLVFGKINDDMQPLFDVEQSPNIITIGWVNSDKVYELFYAADLIVFPGLHSVLWEQAVASKTPCAFSKMEGFEHVNVNGNCILMTGKDYDYYNSMLSDLLDSPNKYDELKENASSPELDCFFYSRIAKQVLQDIGLDKHVV